MIKLGIVANYNKKSATDALKSILNLSKYRKNIFIEKVSSDLINEDGGLPLLELSENVDLILILGGDGTILHTVGQLGNRIKPLLGVNVGRLGFLTATVSEDFEKVLDKIFSDDFYISNRSILSVDVLSSNGKDRMMFNNKDLDKNEDVIKDRSALIKSDSFIALNEVVLGHVNIARMIQVDLSVDDEFLNRFNSDGIIVATPTGSTAYSMSAGGPIVDPTSKVFVISPICPHTISQRSVVISDNKIISIKLVNSRQDEQIDEKSITGKVTGGILTIDGLEKCVIREDCEIRVKKSDYFLPLVFFKDRSFYQVLRKKLFWRGGVI